MNATAAVFLVGYVAVYGLGIVAGLLLAQLRAPARSWWQQRQADELERRNARAFRKVRR